MLLHQYAISFKEEIMSENILVAIAWPYASAKITPETSPARIFQEISALVTTVWPVTTC